MSDLTDRIAAEHVRGIVQGPAGPGFFYDYCTCGEWDQSGETHGQATYLDHLIAATEAAVRAQIAADIAASVDLADHPYVRAGVYDAASIAKGGV